MKVYHGTDIKAADSIMTNGVDVTLGGGELGRGFYVGENPALVAARAKGKNKENFAVIEFKVDVSQFIRLDMKIVRRRELLVKQWEKLMRNNTTRSKLYDVDVVCAPYATFEFSNQYKFESESAETVINNATKTQK